MRRRLGWAVAAVGVALVAWAGATTFWGDPVTSVYTAYEQHRLAARLDRLDATWKREARSRARAGRNAAWIRGAATRLDRTLAEGQPIGRIRIPTIGLNVVFVQGTTASSLAKGPGHYNVASGQATDLPGMGGVVAIAGHRTTFLHPFRHIDALRRGAPIVLQLPYGTFRYRVYAHRIVRSDDWSILRSRPFEELVLSACHPLYSATHRWVVFARLAGWTMPQTARSAASKGR